MNESRESKNAEQLEELLLLTEEIQEELEQKDQLIVELKTQLSESLTLNEKLNKENRAGNIQALKNDLKLADRALQIEKEKLRSAAVIIYFGESIKKTLSVNLLLLFVLSQGVYVGLRCYLKNQLNTKGRQAPAHGKCLVGV